MCDIIKRRFKMVIPAGAWEEVATAVITEATLVEQPKGNELEYRIIAVNKAGEGQLSNTEMVL